MVGSRGNRNLSRHGKATVLVHASRPSPPQLIRFSRAATARGVAAPTMSDLEIRPVAANRKTSRRCAQAATFTSGARACAVVTAPAACPEQLGQRPPRRVPSSGSLSRHNRDRLAADSERRSDRSQGCRCRLAIDSAGADPDDQCAVVLAAHARMAGPPWLIDSLIRRPGVARVPDMSQYCRGKLSDRAGEFVECGLRVSAVD